MKTFLALSVCAVAVGDGAAFAQMGPGHGHGRMADKFFADFDLNRDGKVTRDEVGKVMAARFAAASHNGTMTQEEFATLHMQKFQERTAQMFHRLDWNGDGKLSLDEFASPQRARFEMMDRDGMGAESCAPPVHDATYRPSHRFHHGEGRAHFCAENDLNHDGQVTHAELDQATAKRFSDTTGGAKTMNQDQFAAYALKRYREGMAQYAARLDTDHDGKLSLAEFSAPAMKLFAHLDKKGDGAITRDELSVHGQFHHDGG
jgi:Ca2+-binding EF-hand superfamily protein